MDPCKAGPLTPRPILKSRSATVWWGPAHDAETTRDLHQLIASTMKARELVKLLFAEADIRQIRRDDAAIPILAMSGGGRVLTDDVLDIARRLGASGTIAEPFSAAELIGKVRAILIP